MTNWLTYRFTLAPDLSLERVAQRLPFTYTGADFYALCSDAMLKAITRSARLVDARVAEINRDRAAEVPSKSPITIAYFFDHFASEEYTQVVVTEEDFFGAQKELVPSVSAEELGHYERVRKEFEGGKEKENKDQSSAAATGLGKNGATARDQTAEMLRREMKQRAITSANSSMNGQQGSNGTSNGKGKAMAPPLQNTVVDDEDYIVRTDHLSLNGSGKGKGKGKGKSVAIAAPEDGFGDAAAADDDMYA